MGYRVARVAHVGLMIWLGLLFLSVWLTLLRSMMGGAEYGWSARFLGWEFAGAGLDGDFGYLLAKTALGLALIRLGWRQPNGAFRAALPALLALLLADTLHAAVTQAPSLWPTLVAPLLDGAMLGLALWWARNAPELRVPPLRRMNRVLLAAAVLLLPVQYILLRAGAGESAAAWPLVVAWGLLSAGLAPWRSRFGIVGPAGAT